MKKETKKGFRIHLGWLFSVFMIGLIGLTVWGMFDKGEASAEELNAGSNTHPHVFGFSPNDETVWIGTHTGIFERQQGKWRRTVPKLSRNDVMGMEVDHQNPNRIYVSGHGFVKRSVDGGNTWTSIENGLPNDPKPDAPDAHQLLMDPQNPDHLYVILMIEGDNLYETRDGGDTWKSAGKVAMAYSAAVAPDNRSSILAGTEAGLYRYDLNAGSMKETLLSDQPVFQIVPFSNGNVLVMNEEGFAVTSDFRNWKPFSVDLNDDIPLGIHVSKKDPNRWIILTRNYSLYESRNAGKDWNKVSD